MANSKPNHEYNRMRTKVYDVEFMTPGRAPAERMKRALIARCAEETNGYSISGNISASHKGRVSGKIVYSVASGAATPTHIRKLVAGLAKKANTQADDIVITLDKENSK